MDARHTGRMAAATAEGAARSRTAQRLARVGYVAKGILYATIGSLAIGLATGGSGKTTGTRGALESLADAPYGKVLLWIVAAGLVGLVFWRIAQSVFDLEGAGTDGKAIVKRIGLGVSAVIYASLFVATIRLLMGSGSGAGDDQTQSWTARLLQMPFGQALVAAVGVAIGGYGIQEIIKGVKNKFHRKLDLDGIAARQSHWIRRIATFGLLSRGAVFALMGPFFLYAAFTSDPSEARGLGQMLGTIAEQPYGTVVLLIVAVGLVAYAVYSFVEARYRRLPAR